MYVHSEDGTGKNRERDVVGSTNLRSESDDSAADGKAEEDNRDCLSGSESERHNTGNGASERRSKHIGTPISPVVLRRYVSPRK